MENLKIYNAVRTVPKEALKEIQAGRLKGMSDINPMWRIKLLTEQFGLCGLGWKYKIISQVLETGGKEEISAFVTIELFIKIDGEWSDGIPGVGGSSYVAAERSGLHTSDECFKMALTDAISVSCKALGFGADVYWQKDTSKYDKVPNKDTELPKGNKPIESPTDGKGSPLITEGQRKRLYALSKANVELIKEVLAKHKYVEAKEVTVSNYKIICDEIEKGAK